MNENYKNWEVVKGQIHINKIKRFNYMKLLNESLTSFITRNMKLSNKDLLNKILNKKSVEVYLNENEIIRNKFISNVEISICSRKAEQLKLIMRLDSNRAY
jgi:hypothetical protein